MLPEMAAKLIVPPAFVKAAARRAGACLWDRVMMSPLFRLCAALVLAVFLCHPALAQDKAAPADKAAVQDLDQLVKTLENDADRQALVRQLKAVLAAQKGKAQAPADAGVLETISGRLQDFGDDAMDAVAALQDAPQAANWLIVQLGDTAVRSRWAGIVGKMAAILVAGIAADQCLSWLLRRPRRRLAPRGDAGEMTRLLLGSVLAVMELAPVAALAAAAYGMLTVFALTGNPRIAALMVVTAYASVRLVMVAGRLVLAPRIPSLRLLPCGDETAEYLSIWLRRLAGVGMFGYFAMEAARLLGLPKGGYAMGLKAVGLAMAAMMVIFILQNRGAVAGLIRSDREGRGALGSRLLGLRNRLADIWHVLAVLYVVAGYAVWAVQIKGGFEFMLRASVLSVLILVLAGAAITGLRHVVDRGFALSQETRDSFPMLEGRANRYLPVLHMALRVLVVLVSLVALGQAWGIDTMAAVASPAGRRVLGAAISISAVLVGALIIWELASGAVERYLASTDQDGNPLVRSARARTLLPLLRNALMVVLTVMVSLIVLSELGVNIAPLLAGAGVVGIAIGFGSQKLVQDVITGAFILFEDTISVGNVVQLGSHSGTVEAISIRAIRLRDGTGAVHTVPFSAVGTVVNMTKDFSRSLLDVGVAYREDTDHVSQVLVELGAELRADPVFGAHILDPMELIGVDKLADSAVIIRVSFKTVAGKQWAVTREFNRRVKRRFDELGIEIPFPQSSVWFGQDKAGNAPAGHLRLDGPPSPAKDEASA